MQRHVIRAGRCEIALRVGVMPCRREVRSYIDCSSGDRDWFGKVYLLPSRSRFTGEGRRGESRASAAPKAPGVCSGVVNTLVVSDTRDVAADICFKLHTK